MVARKFPSINKGIQLAKHNIINAHLERPKLKNTTYTSLHVQNEIINIGKNIIKKYLVVTISSVNPLFFITLCTVTGSVIATCDFDGCLQLGLDFKNVRGQWYDGASNMSCEWIRLQID